MSKIPKPIPPVLLIVVAAAFAYFAIDNAQTYWASNHPPAGAEVITVRVMTAETQEICSRGNCSTEMDAVTFLGPGLEPQRAPAHAAFSAGDSVQAFQDQDGDWQVKGAFTKTWVARTVGLTGGPALALLVIAGLLVLRRGVGGSQPPASSAVPPS